jgi:phage gpG-like protein
MARRSRTPDVKILIEADAAQDRIQDVKDRAGNLKPVLKWAGEELERAYSSNFTTMGLISARAMLKGAWPPLNAEYGAWKATRYPGAPTLVQTGELFRSVANITQNSESNIDDMSAEFAVTGKIAKFHQYGTENMPARKIIFVPRDFDKELGKKTAKYLKYGSE